MLLIALASACATTPPATETFKLPPPRDDFYEQYFERYANRLDLFRASPGGEIEQALLIVDSSFYEGVGIALHKDTMLEEGSHFACCSLMVSIRDLANDTYVKTGEVGEFTSVLKRYAVDVSQEEAGIVAAAIKESGFYTERFTDKNDSLCTDGTTYWLEANFDNNHNLIARHTCDNGFKTKIAAADSLFSLAMEKFPMIADRLKRMQSAIKNYPD